VLNEQNDRVGGEVIHVIVLSTVLALNNGGPNNEKDRYGALHLRPT
jgi:hypothetical protein